MYNLSIFLHLEESMYREVDQFAHAMKEKLRKREKDYPDGWKSSNIHTLFEHLLSEVDELQKSISDGTSSILNESVDVANIAMMIADVSGELNARGD